ncbi:RNA-binding protein Cwf29 [Mycoemilia scoparia]|uniref:RNA-binding protein Cwf29 n=1 Tax=Mycoemilia scoparia TaxID=417184 RepID=A0A9W8A125_9FUNG|nr:RNA-binding protein Cwf29 [Mycoemilia scoparia]
MNVVQEISRINRQESQHHFNNDKFNLNASWHNEYKDSAYIFVGGLDFDLTEGDVICVFSQYGEIFNINLVRDRETGKSKGFAFLQYEDQRSTILAVDNLNGVKLLGRTLRVDHTKDYKQPKSKEAFDEDGEIQAEPVMNAAPRPIEAESEDEGELSDETLLREGGIDPDDLMASYYLKKLRKEKRKASKKKEKLSSSKKRKSKSDDKHRSKKKSTKEH